MNLNRTFFTANIMYWALFASLALHGLGIVWLFSGKAEEFPTAQNPKAELQVLLNAPLLEQSVNLIEQKPHHPKTSNAKPKLHHTANHTPTERATQENNATPPETPAPSSTDGHGLAQASNPANPSSAPSNRPVQVLKNPTPPYPRQSKQLEEQGTVILAVHILQTGRVAQVNIQKSSGFSRLDASAQTTVAERWEFSPETQNGVAVDVWYQLPITFKLSN